MTLKQENENKSVIWIVRDPVGMVSGLCRVTAGEQGLEHVTRFGIISDGFLGQLFHFLIFWQGMS